MWSITALRAQRSSGGHLRQLQASTVGGSCARLSRGMALSVALLLAPPAQTPGCGPVACPGASNKARTQPQEGCQVGSTDRIGCKERRGCKGSVRLVGLSHGTRMPQASLCTSQCWVHQRGGMGLAGGTSSRRSSPVHDITRFWFCTLLPEPHQGTGRWQSRVMACQGRSTIEEHATGRLR